MQFRAISHGLYGTQDYHRSVRQKAVEYMQGHKDEYGSFLGQDVDEYLDSMKQPGTWGDELTLVSTEVICLLKATFILSDLCRIL